MWQDILGALGGFGGTPGIMPGAGQPPPMGTPPISPPPTGSGPIQAPPTSIYEKLRGGLFGAGPDGTVDPAAQNRAMIQLGLGMLAGNRRDGFGSALNAYTGAANTYQGAMQQAYQNSERKRIEEKQDKRYEQGIQREDSQRKDDREFKLRQWEAEQKARQAEGEADRRSREKVASMGQGDDIARAELARMEMAREKEKEKLLAPLRDKIIAGTATPQERNAYQLIVTGRQPTDPYGFMGGYGGGQPGAIPGNPLLNDPDL